mgnify:CR=1 FL=1
MQSVSVQLTQKIIHVYEYWQELKPKQPSSLRGQVFCTIYEIMCIKWSIGQQIKGEWDNVLTEIQLNEIKFASSGNHILQNSAILFMMQKLHLEEKGSAMNYAVL